MKKHHLIRHLMIAMLPLSLIYCYKESEYLPSPPGSNAPNDWELNSRTSDAVTTLGPQRPIPYKVEVMRQAYNNLYEPDIQHLKPNYLYVRFLPQNQEDVKALLESGIELWDIPLDYEVNTWGESYHDASISDPNYTWQYAVVPVEAALPAVTTEILEQLALVPEDCALAQEAFNLTGNDYEAPEIFEATPTMINGTFDYHIDRGDGGSDGGGDGGGPGGGDCGCSLPNHTRKPSGCVQVFDNMLNAWEGVIQVQVHTARTQIFGAVFHRKTTTDANGCWKIDHKYFGKVHVWVKWENDVADVKTMESDVDLWGYSFPRKAYIGKFNGPNFNNIPIKFDFTNAIGTWNFRNWAASSANNAVFEFGGFLGGQGISRALPGNLKILITPWGQDGNTGAAPMLDKIGPFQQFILYGTATAILTGILGAKAPGTQLLVLPIATWLQTAAPDIVFNFNNPADVNADDFRELAYHELAHALHFDQAGSAYWLDNMVYTMAHLGYGDGTAPGAGRCSVIESWGFQIGMLATHLRYGQNNSNVGNPLTNTWRARLEREMVWDLSNPVPHIPYGWEWDIQDNNATNPMNEIENGMVTDRVFGINNAQIFNTMTSNMLSMGQMKDALAPFLPPAVPLVTYDQLCAPYGF